VTGRSISIALKVEVLQILKRAIEPLANALEYPELGENVYKALKKFGPVCISEVVKRIEYRIAHPIENGSLGNFNAIRNAHGCIIRRATPVGGYI